MHNPPDLKEILRNNPHIDEEGLNRVTHLLDALKRAGVQQNRYSLVPNSSRRSMAANENAKGEMKF